MAPTTNEPKMTQLEIVRAVTNSPALATRTFTMSGRTFEILDLQYDDYMLFMAQLQPLFEALLGALPGVRNMGLLNTLSPATLITYCGKSLPEMARIVCSQSDPDITVAEVKKLGKTPFVLAALVLSQVEQNNIINAVKDFFESIVPLMKAALSQK